MNIRKFPSGAIIGVLLIIFFFGALSLRIFLPYDQVFSGGWIKFTSNDAYYYMRLVDNTVGNFPHLTTFDPYYIYPGTYGIGGVHFFDWFLACIIWIIGLGAPTQHTVDVVGVYFPTVLAALTVIPVYFIGKALFNRWAGVIAAALIAIMPGEFMGRSILGFTDQHVAETLFSTAIMAFLMLAIKTAGQRQLTFSHLIQRDWKVIVRPLVYSVLAGIFLGIYYITWQGALLFVFIISLYLVIQFIIDHLRHKSSDHLGIAGAILFLVALIIFLPLSPDRHLSVAAVVAFFIPLVLSGISRLESGRGLKPVYYPLTLVGIAVVFLGIFYALAPDILNPLLAGFKIFAPAGATATTTLEMQPFLKPGGSFSALVAWGNFTTSFFLTPRWPIPGFAIISFIILIWLFIKQRSDEKHRLLFLVWTLVILVATLVQRRFAYYLVVNVTLLSAYLSWQAIWWSGLRKLATKPEEKAEKEHRYFEASKKRDYYEVLGIARGASNKEINRAFRKLSAAYHPDRNRTPEAEEKLKEINKAYEVLSDPEKRTAYDHSRHEATERKKTKKHLDGQGITIYHVNAILAIIIVCLLVFLFNILKSIEVASSARFAPSNAWESSLHWMKENTPEPLGDANAYNRLFGSPYEYPKSAYGVASWWDYGYWISRTAHRLPSTNPSQAPEPITKVANLFLSKDESSAQKIMAELGASYIIADYTMTTNKFWAIVTWAGREQSEFTGVYYLPSQGKLEQVQVLYPEYYRLMLVRLYNFDGKAVTAVKPVVIGYDEKADRRGNRYRQITDVEEFSSYQEALDYVKSKGAANHIIVGINPFVSPVPLEEMQSYKLVYRSETGVSQPGLGLVPEVKVFEYDKK